MKILCRVLAALGITCLCLGVLLMCVSMLTGGGYESVVTHQTAMPYIESARSSVEAVLRSITVAVYPQ